jgi:DNA-binding transcriptional MerR regulator
VKATTLRFYERVRLPPAQRSGSGYRFYDDGAIERPGFISSGKHPGLPLEEIRDLLQVWEDELCTDVRTRLRPMLVARIGEAEQRAARCGHCPGCRAPGEMSAGSARGRTRTSLRTTGRAGAKRATSAQS